MNRNLQPSASDFTYNSFDSQKQEDHPNKMKWSASKGLNLLRLSVSQSSMQGPVVLNPHSHKTGGCVG